jgi:predicted ribosomally synthesized peptide with SipW-like signal peptide
MSVKKIAGLLGAFGLMAALIGGGVSAAFTSQVSAVQHLSVGSFGCQISSASDGAIVNGDQTSVDFTSPTIMSSLPGQAPFEFTVTSTGNIPVNLHVTEAPALSAPWSDMLGSQPDVLLTQGQTHQYNAGVSWTELGNDNIGQQGTVAYTINCGEGPTMSFVSTDNNSNGRLTDVLQMANFPPNDPITLTYAINYPTSPLQFFGSVTTAADGTATQTWTAVENCYDPDGVTLYSTNETVTMNATDGTNTWQAVVGTVVCSQEHP